MIGKCDAANHLMHIWDTLQHKIFEAKRKLIETHQTLNPENIKNKLLEKWNQPKYYAHGNI